MPANLSSEPHWRPARDVLFRTVIVGDIKLPTRTRAVRPEARTPPPLPQEQENHAL